MTLSQRLFLFLYIFFKLDPEKLIRVLIFYFLSNVFLKKGCIKLGDLGEAKQISGTTANTYTGTQPYMSPEMHKKYFERAVLINEKTDVW